MKNRYLGLITYHSAYNYGSVFQAYATQLFLMEHFPEYKIDIINYRLKKQKQYYSIIRFNYGKMALLRDILQMPILFKRVKRSKRFENFISSEFFLTEEYAEPEQVYSHWNKYDVVISGSDQIWNKHSCELHTNEWKYIFPYVLHDFNGKRISYASSVGGMSDDEVEVIKDDILLFDKVSMREQGAASHLEQILGLHIEKVLDPTFLLEKSDWVRLFNLRERKAKPYIFYYSLNRNYSSAITNLKKIVEFAKNNDLAVRILTPYTYLYDVLYKNTENCCDAGPTEFLNHLYNAELVITDSYHGTALSINFNKSFLVIGINKQDRRITELLEKVGINSRYIDNISKLEDIKDYKLDYTPFNAVLDLERQYSASFLIDAIKKS